MKPVQARKRSTEGCTLRVPVQVYVKDGKIHRYHELSGSATRIDVATPKAVEGIVAKLKQFLENL